MFGLRARLRVGLVVTGLCGLLGWQGGPAVAGKTPAQSQSSPQAAASAEQKVFRYAFPVAETGFDPVQVSDLYSNIVLQNLFDAPLTYDYLARPSKLKPAIAAGMPEVSADSRVFTVKLKPGIYYDNHPVFKGVKREVTADDIVYTVKRNYDPKYKSPNLSSLENAKILGLSELRKEAVTQKTPFDYKRPVEGIVALDRYTIQVKLAEPDPRFIHKMADPRMFGAIPREVVDTLGEKLLMEQPVGTGPFRLAQWKRSSRMVLERNPNYREEYYDAEPPADDPRSQEIYRKFKGKRLPLVDRVEIYIVEETQPRWLAFLNAEHDLLNGVPPEFVNIAIPGGKVSANLSRRGVTADRMPALDIAMTYFNMEHPVVGGYEPHKVALRRAISLAYNNSEEIRSLRRGQAIPAQSAVPPGVGGFDPDFRSDASTHNVAKAKALLDLYGYVDKDGDGWRDLPDGKPLVLEYSSQPDNIGRQQQELWRKFMKAIDVRIEFKIAKWPEQLKASRAGKLMMWGVGWSATEPDGETFLNLGFSASKGQANHARFSLPAYDKLFLEQKKLPDGPERVAAFREANRLVLAYAPYKWHVHRIGTDLMHPWLEGYRRHPVLRGWFKYIDIDPRAQAAAQ